MVVFYLRNSRAPDDKIVPLTVSLQLDPVKSFKNPVRPDQVPTISGVTASGIEFPNLTDPEGDSIWLLMVAPPRDELDKDTGQPIPPEFVNLISEETFHEEIQAAMGRIGDRVAWTALLPDNKPPQLESAEPALDANTDVHIQSNVIYRITEPLPSSGLDLSTLQMTLNGFPIITSGVAQSGESVEFRGNVFDFQIIYRPKRSYN